MTFDSNAAAYTITMLPGSSTSNTYSQILNFYGEGIVNDSGTVQNFVTQGAPGPESDDPGAIYFMASSAVGRNVVFTNQGSGASETAGGYTRFGLQLADNPSAGNATFINEGGKVSGTYYGGFTDLVSDSTANAAIFINQPGEVSGAAAGITYVYTGGSIGTSTFVNNPAAVPGAEGGWTEIDGAICAGSSFLANGATIAGAQGGQVYSYGGTGYATFTASGGQGSGTQGGLLEIHNIADSSETVVVAQGGTNGGLGGMITINSRPTTLDQVQFQVLGNATMDLTGLSQPSAVIGSLSGQGTVSLSRRLLDVGSNNMSTSFSGIIQNSGGVSKSGTGTLTLSGANTYKAGTTINAGALIASNSSGSATGTGSIAVNGGTLGGGGTIAGAVTVGTGSNSGAILQPGFGTNKKVTLTIQGLLTFNADATYNFGLKNKRAEIVANGVTIASGAQFTMTAPNRSLPARKTATVISNTSTTPISGTFANLPDGGTITVGNNTFKANYEGGDGNDLTLTVQ
ncbi:MAG: autotransporter-associated beta strand repeat-containing protein [Candidatus Acidiferrum sp.]